ncbi:MAG: hypothetical protein AAGA77_25800 [Bacteroidota bacterium]
MKVSKTLLQTIAAGLVIAGSLQSCTKEDFDAEHKHDENCTVDCEIGENEANHDIWDCPPCGMG